MPPTPRQIRPSSSSEVGPPCATHISLKKVFDHEEEGVASTAPRPSCAGGPGEEGDAREERRAQAGGGAAQLVAEGAEGLGGSSAVKKMVMNLPHGRRGVGRQEDGVSAARKEGRGRRGHSGVQA